MKHYILFAFLLFSMVLNAQKQIYNFNVIHNGKPLGILDATKTVDGNSVIYTSHTVIEYHLLVPIHVVYDYYVTYENNILQEATAHIVVKGNDRTNIRTVKTDKGYNYYSEGELEKTISQAISHSVVQLLFEEPIGITKIYAEEHGLYHSIKKTGDHIYVKTASNGHKNTYHYKNGILQKSDVDAGVIAFSIIKKD